MDNFFEKANKVLGDVGKHLDNWLEEEKRKELEAAAAKQRRVALVKERQARAAEKGVLCCLNCGSENVQVGFVEVGQKTGRRGLGFGGKVNNAARGVGAVATLGVSNLFWKKSQGVNYTKTNMSKRVLCQSCGFDWEID